MKTFLLQALVFFIIFHSISWLRELTLLDTDGSHSVPSLEVQQGNGTRINLDQFKGQPVVYYFWAPWCTVCKVSMPNLQEFHQQNGKNVKVVAIALSYDSKQEVLDFMANNDFDFEHVLGDMNVSQAFKIQGFPTYYIADEKGMLVAKSMGYSSEIGMHIRSYIL